MRNEFDQELVKIIEDEIKTDFNTNRNGLRISAKEQISKIQQEISSSYNKKRKSPISYKVDDLFAIKRTQYGPTLKINRNYLGPYCVTKVNGHDRYEVEKVAVHERPSSTTSAADYMKPLVNTRDAFDSSGSDEDCSGRPDVGIITSSSTF